MALISSFVESGCSAVNRQGLVFDRRCQYILQNGTLLRF